MTSDKPLISKAQRAENIFIFLQLCFQVNKNVSPRSRLKIDGGKQTVLTEYSGTEARKYNERLA